MIELSSQGQRVESFMDAAVKLGAEFLSCGGPVTRLEAQLSLAGAGSGYETNVHATPSAITVYCLVRSQQESYSRGDRMYSFGIDLGRLCLIDKLLSRFATGKIYPIQVVGELMEIQRRAVQPSAVVHFISVFGIGAGASLLSGVAPLPAVECGLFGVTIQLIVGLMGRLVKISSVFADFLACFLAFLIATVIENILAIPSEVLVLGTLVYVVPGLLLTTAVSEIVDQNYLAGSIRLLRALCTFMAMALAYFLAEDLAHALFLNLRDVPLPVGRDPTFLFRVFGSVLIILGSAFEFRSDVKSLPGVLCCGLSGATGYFITQTPGSLVAPHFFAAFTIGLLSYLLSRRYGHPSQIYSVPSILILAPGMLALSSFGYGVHENLNLPSLVRAALISLSIVFGLAASRLPFRNP